MNIIILDGLTVNLENKWTQYIANLVSILKGKGNSVNHIILKELKIEHCTGCFGCWVKTPGTCVINDDSLEINRVVLNSDFVLWASPLVMGFPSYFLKRTLDRTIPLIHPYFEIVNGEAHHRARYEKYPLFGLLVHPSVEDDMLSLMVVNQLFSRTALNLKSRLCFADTTSLPVDELASKVEKANQHSFDITTAYIPKELDSIKRPYKLTVFNGSPRGKSGNTPILLEKIVEGFNLIEGNRTETFHLQNTKYMQQYVQAYENADCVVLGFPLYTDGMPGIVKEFIESLDHLKNRKQNPAMAYLVHSGFPEAAHSRYIEQYLIELTKRLNSIYLGTIIHGGSEGVRMMPDNMNKQLFNGLKTIGKGLAEEGRLNEKVIKYLAGLESYSPLLIPFIKLLTRTPIIQMYWNMQLRKNRAYNERFAQPLRG